jgi:hypothetical protein
MSPLLPPVGVEVEMYRTPNPFESLAMLSVLEFVRSPPPVNPAPVLMAVELAAAPRSVLAASALFAPVPPAEIAA